MAYVRPAGTRRLSSQLPSLLAQAAELTIPPQDLTDLTAALSDQYAAAAALDRLDLADVHPALDFNPDWVEDAGGDHEQGVV